MKQLHKYFNNYKLAEVYQNKLYNKYNHVKLVYFPIYPYNNITSLYVFEVE